MTQTLIRPILNAATTAVRLKMHMAAPEMRRVVCCEVHLKQTNDSQDAIDAALRPMFDRQVKAISSDLLSIRGRSVRPVAKSTATEAAGWVDMVFNPRDWNEEMVNRALPPLAISTGRAAKSQLILMSGVAEERATTASDWLAAQDSAEDLEDVVFATPQGNVSMRIATEWPPWMKDQIKVELKNSFSQDYWAKVNETTRTDVGRFIEKGLIDGQGIEQIARNMVPELLQEGKYALRRARNIARTESGNALNGGRKMSIDHLDEELGEAASIIASWLSILGNTTRDTHANLHGVFADKDGLWDLGGVRVPWPSHFALPVEERASCQCTVTHEFGVASS